LLVKKTKDERSLPNTTKQVTPKVLNKILKGGKIPPPKYTNYKDVGPRAENIKVSFNGKIVQFPDNTKPSINFKILEERNVSKDKLHFMVNKQNDNSIVIVKYNEKAELKLKDFILELMNYYKKNVSLKDFLQEIVVEGNETFSIVKNIPNVDFQEKPLIDIITNDLMKLLK
jgi:hypothetical protein